MAEHDIELDLSVLEQLDFPVPCGHSQHNNNEFVHDGDAEFIAVSYHDCPDQPGHPPPYYYPCCAVWAAYVTANGQLNRGIVCSRCGQRGEWREFVRIIDQLT